MYRDDSHRRVHLWVSGRDPGYSSGCGRTWWNRAQSQPNEEDEPSIFVQRCEGLVRPARFRPLAKSANIRIHNDSPRTTTRRGRNALEEASQEAPVTASVHRLCRRMEIWRVDGWNPTEHCAQTRLLRLRVYQRSSTSQPVAGNRACFSFTAPLKIKSVKSEQKNEQGWARKCPARYSV
ncbi:hypothetical protein F4861DRAFT_453047 [Xylaria intraflava]|nr:hypothetical protein F4861DRAFT_453047 [Xylaria intraflava]